ncbi:hypothetical protein CA850_24900 [Micromonospora echinospora]|uniref:Fibronectin type 3 domain-containing protein n=1 Tax=Micromonospora echinospora TaxID=1877 RepID=A0A1C4ZJU6_MICEC|nr:fibronectin type III domain-containing protein [Micromonospora echinospora]OZV77010.1 hypothetical protein CA850_24900 [Micromonospora echinospora]SCF33064.1 fibronectin type 3 domain-containing protein [Micromonospora echinospora]
MSPPLRRRGAILLATVLGTLATTAPAASAGSTGPATPTALWASTTGSSISLTWEQPRTGSRATAFRVYENDQVVARTTTTAAYLDVPFGSTHTYTVTAVDRRGRESARATPATGRSWQYGYNPECMPDPGVPVSVREVTASAVAIAWTRHPLGGDLELRVDGRSLGPVPGTSVRVGGLTPAASHQFALYRYSQCPGSGGPRLAGSLTATTAPGDPARLAAPTGLTVTGRTDSTVDLSWTAPPGTPPTRYAIYDGATLVAATTGTTVTVDRLYHATWHRFTVAALDAAGNESTHSAAATVATETCLTEPPRPVDLRVTGTSPSSARLAWIFDSTADSYTVLDGDTPVATTRYAEAVLTGLPSASAHAYRVVASLAQGCGASPRSRRVEVTTPDGPPARPAAPASLVVSGNVPAVWPSSAQVTLTWSSSTGGEPPAGYRLYEGATVVGETAGTSLTLPVGAGTTHEYVVVAVDASGHESAPSPRVTVRAMYLPPP